MNPTEVGRPVLEDKPPRTYHGEHHSSRRPARRQFRWEWDSEATFWLQERQARFEDWLARQIGERGLLRGRIAA